MGSIDNATASEGQHDSLPVSRVTASAAVAGLVVGSLGGAQAALASQAATPVSVAPVVATAPAAPSAAVRSTVVKVHHVQGKFSFSQDVVTPIEQIARDMRGVSRVLGGGASSEVPAVRPLARPLSWRLSVQGAVSAPFTASLGELAQRGSRDAVMSYTCLNNPADGRATANAATTGVTVRSILERAGADPRANVVTFVSTDGYEIRLPLSYVTSHAGMIAYRLNGEPLAKSVGCTNQLWLAGTSAHYFVRDVSSIHVSRETSANIPPVPGTPASGDQFRNRPNVGVLGGFSIA